MNKSEQQGGHAHMPLAEILAALSYALDITEGQPEGHCIRACWIGVHIGREIGLDDDALWELYYTLLLKDLGCSSNAARICELYLTDDRSFKRDFKTVDSGVANALEFVFGHTGLKSDLAGRFRAIANIFKNGDAIVQEMIETRCQRGADIARQLRFPETVAQGIHCLDEHWNGAGRPDKLVGEDIPLYSRIALLGQVIDVFHQTSGREAAIKEAKKRSGRWFDPVLVAAFQKVSSHDPFWEGLEADDLESRIFELEPAQRAVIVDDDFLDDIAAAFGQVVDAKSPYTSGHSTRVALYADLLGQELGVSDDRRRWLKRAALLHDVGKLGVSNSILDKPGKLDEDEWQDMRSHAVHSENILSRISAFGELARSAAAHHERLDGKGYPRGVSADDIELETRIITIADFFDALTADRPYRAAMPLEKALAIIESEVGKAVDERCFGALLSILDSMKTIREGFGGVVPPTTSIAKTAI